MKNTIEIITDLERMFPHTTLGIRESLARYIQQEIELFALNNYIHEKEKTQQAVASLTDLWIVTIYRNDSQTPIKYDLVKHYWWEKDRLVISCLYAKDSKAHFYWIWPKESIGHIKAERIMP